MDSPRSLDAARPVTLLRAQSDLLLSPASAYRWADLAETEIDANNVDRGKFCIRQALAAAPGNPAILFRAANFYLRLEDYPEMLRHLTSVLRNPELVDYYDRVFALYSQMDLPLDELLNQGLPRTPRIANAFLRYWVNQGKLEEAQETWAWINRNSLTSNQAAGSYIALLAKASRWDEALQSWSSYTAKLDAEYTKTNWIYNGGFEMKLVDCPFDWHFQSSETLNVARDSEVSYQGGASLRLIYSGTQQEDSLPAYQTVLLEPGQWQLRAAMRTQKLTSDQGIVIRVVDAQYPSRLDVATNTFQGSQEWTTLSQKFEVKPDTRLLRIEIMRPHPREFDSQIRGTVWLDAIELQQVQKGESLQSAR